ncbi:cyclophilin-like peptidyl-prolyl cis-trans isomerase family protein [Actinidia rufa]|uniref:Cyclophilin-like peptidyl-prolyl cis-trans isomerase family protein n=1 Tax=Actinidia rufa TaxID=165716 RepID=A0A7J0EVC0_9ERIC|nr:cyclophilin-like peptidyl-prolyl cis-trans isomerase family protein [Actinidia rufa]
MAERATWRSRVSRSGGSGDMNNKIIVIGERQLTRESWASREEKVSTSERAGKFSSAYQMAVTLHTNLGDIKCEIACDEVPKAAEVEIQLVQVKEGPVYGAKKFNDEIRESLKHNARGVLAMANSGPNTNGSQFFIIYAKQPHLNGLYTVFGKVIHGFEVLDLMEKTPTGPGDRPLAEIRMNRVTIHANPLAG